MKVEDEERPIYPFTAIVAQNDVKTALILNAIDPSIGGALFTGPKGTGKSSIVRAAAEILPEVEVVEDCVFNCSPSDPTNMCETCRTRFLNSSAPLKRKKRTRVVSLPIGASEDRVIGSLDVEKAIKEGTKALQPGLLAEANQGILYIDEVNLLPDHTVDMILDASASGWNIIEREGISITHPSRFILVGTMNPEEGELRPQILDRFGLHARAQSLLNPKERIEVIRRNEEFSRNPLVFRERYEAEQEELRKRIVSARENLPRVKVSESVMESVAKICSSLQVDGYRPDIVIIRTAKVLAAFNGRDMVQANDVVAAAELALGHRTRREGQMIPPTSKEIREALESTPVGNEVLVSKTRRLRLLKRLGPLKKFGRGYLLLMLLVSLSLPVALFFWFFFSFDLLSQLFALPPSVSETPFRIVVALALTLILTSFIFIARRPRKMTVVGSLDLAKITLEQMSGHRVVVKEETQDKARTQVSDVKLPAKYGSSLKDGQRAFEGPIQQAQPTERPGKTLSSREERVRQGRSYLVGKRAKVVTSVSRGRYVWHEFPKEKPWDIALGPTIRAASPYQQVRKSPDLSVVMKPQDIRIKMREYRAPFSIVLLVDMSMSMAMSLFNLGRAIRTLHTHVYRRRDRVGLVVFKGADAFILQQPTTNLDLAIKKLWDVRTSDLTPMAAGMFKAWKTLRLEKQRNRDSILMLIILSDGIANIPLKQPLSSYSRRRFLSEAQADVMDVARFLVRDGIRTVVINTSHSLIEYSMWQDEFLKKTTRELYTPTEFLMELSKVTNGSYYGLALRREEEVPVMTKKRKLDDWFYFETETAIA